MRLLPDYNMRSFSSIAASSESPLFPAVHLIEYDPVVIWQAADFAAAVTLTIDLGAAATVDKIWLNNANFLFATIQANSTNSWSAPAISRNVTLSVDDVGIIKGYFDLSTAAYRYVRVVIPVQTLADSDSVPFLGNIIIGKDLDFSPVSKWNPDVSHEYYTFTSDGGNYFKTPRTRSRHVFGVAIEHIPKAEYQALPLNRWGNAIIFTGLDEGDSYLVYPPAGRRNSVANPIDCSTEFVLEELV